MSLEGKAATDSVLRGKINGLDVLCIDAYGVAVRNGFEGTEAEWLASLKGEKGEKGEKGDSGAGVAQSYITYIDLPSAEWVGTASLYSQIVSIDGVTEHSKIDLNPSVEQLAIFHDKDIAFVTENEEGVVTVYCIGQKPTIDYSMQITITEVAVNG